MNELNDKDESKADNLQPIIVLVLAFLGFVFLGGIGSWLGGLIANLYDVKMNTLLQTNDGQALNLSERQAIRWFNLFAHVFAFTLTTLIVVRFAKKTTNCIQYLQIDQKVKGTTLLWSVLALLLIFPSIQLIYWLNLQLPLPQWMMEMGQSQDWLVAEVLNMENISELFFVLIVAAVAPAVGEELLFRGLIQKEFIKITNSSHLGIWVTAFLFSAIHMQFAGFFPRFLLGAFLGYLYIWSGSLWLPIIIHFLFNGVQVVASYLNPELAASSSMESIETSNLLIGIGTLVLLIPVLLKIKNSVEESHPI